MNFDKRLIRCIQSLRNIGDFPATGAAVLLLPKDSLFEPELLRRLTEHFYPPIRRVWAET